MQLRSFVVLAEELSFRKAAQKLYLTQPALSKQIRLLEESFGAPLFQRSARAVYLTSAGRFLLGKACTLLAQAGRLEAEMTAQRKGDVGTIVVGVAKNLIESIRCVGIEHSKRCPSVKLVYREVLSPAQYAALRTHEIDVGFVRPHSTSAHIVSKFLFREPLVVVVRKDHPLSNRKKVTLAQLANEAVYLFPRFGGKGMHETVLSLYRNAGITPRVVRTALTPEFVMSTCVAFGKGITILPAGFPIQRELATMQLNERNAAREIHIAWRKQEQSQSILQFVETAKHVWA